MKMTKNTRSPRSLSQTRDRASIGERPSPRASRHEDDAFEAPSLFDEDADATDKEAPADDNGPDDSLGLYLRQMGAIPLLNRDQELALARKLERARSRFRRAVLSNWITL